MRRFGILAAAFTVVLTCSSVASAGSPAAHRLGSLPRSVGLGGMTLVNRTLYVSAGNEDALPVTRLTRVSSSRKVLVQRDFEGISSAPAVGEGNLWVTTSNGARGVVAPESGWLFRFDPLTLRRTGRVAVGEGATAPVVGAGSVFVAVGAQVLRVDAASLHVTARHKFRTGTASDRFTTLAFADGWLWVLDDANGEPGPTRVLRIDPHTMTQTVESSLSDSTPTFATGGSRLWLVYGGQHTATRVREIQMSTGHVVVDEQLSRLPFAVAVVSADAANNLWYLTTAGALGRVSPDGSRSATSIDLRQLDPSSHTLGALVSSTTRLAVATEHGIEEFAPS